ncbi:hypothetical protein DMZ99_00435 [Salmonella enterica subsp. enterica serovar Gatuni]|nr:hypothetical protein [Salmonella enterica]EBR8557205.1 hypothetical protein [Salmonella enterica subsp. enterica serovar Gatuni]ECF6920845.1 hypothetical protein [Salmonella enterica subsp. enterica]EBL0668417.1 hypothetical protein [Salmonella enterica]EBS2630591.1 hypothetical protein [Salmonella enterica subsp. enterica serovar Gatuni]
MCNCLILICSIQHQKLVALWTKNTWHSQSINFIPAAAGIKIVLHEGKPIHFATTVIALSSDRYLEMCDLYSSQAIE